MCEFDIDRIDFRLLRYFSVVAEELHFGRAAARVRIAQPALSQQIRKLEHIIHVEVFERTSRKVLLTAAGAALLEAVQRARHAVEHGVAAAQAAGRGEAGVLRIGYAATAMMMFLPALIRDFRNRTPSARLVLRAISTSTQLEMLRHGELDVGFATDVESDDELVVHKRWRESFVLVTPTVPSKNLILFPRAQTPVLYDRILRLAQSNGLTGDVVQEAESWDSIVQLVAAGLGCTIAPASVKRYRIKGVRYQALKSKSDLVSVCVVTINNSHSPALRNFMQVVLA